jgi:large subunit ribosomal protein L21
MSYAIISVGGKQYRVREGERLLVDRLAHDEGKTFSPAILLAGGDGEAKLSPDDVVVTAKVLGHVRGPKIRVFKFKPKRGYRRTTGFRSALTQIEIESIGSEKKRSRAKSEQPAEPVSEVEATAAEARVEAEAPAEQPKPARKPKPRAAAKKTTEEGSE